MQDPIYIINVLITHRIFLLARNWSKRVGWTNIPQLKLGNIRECAHCEKDIICSLYYMFLVLSGHYLFLVAHSFPRATLSAVCR